MKMTEKMVDDANNLMGDLSDAIIRTTCAFFGRKSDEDGFELVGEEVYTFMAAIGPLFVRIAVDMGMTKDSLKRAVEESWEHATGDCDSGEAH